jgi:hypothetical protein
MKKILFLFFLTFPGLFGLSQEFNLNELIKMYNSSIDLMDDMFLKKGLVFSNFITDEGHPDWLIYHYADKKLKDSVEQSISFIIWVDTSSVPDHLFMVNLDLKSPENYLKIKAEVENIGMKKIEAELINKRLIHSKYEGAKYSITFNHDIIGTDLPFSVILKKK